MSNFVGTFQFGVELELLLRGRKKVFTSWHSLAKDVSRRLSKAGITNHINEGHSKALDNYREWSITPEITIPNQPDKNIWGIELVSPICSAAWYWASDLDTIYAAIGSSYSITPSAHCSTHVHISSVPTALSSTELALMAKAALYFEPALDSLMPPERQSSATYWCQSNRTSQALKDHSLEGCFEIIDLAAMARSKRAIVEAFNLFPASSAFGRAHGNKHDFVRGKAFKWDFSGMISTSAGGTGLGTIEFRQPPGSTGVEAASAWVTLALSFVAGITVIGDFGVIDIERGASTAELWSLLRNGAASLGWEDLSILESLLSPGSSDSN